MKGLTVIAIVGRRRRRRYVRRSDWTAVDCWRFRLIWTRGDVGQQLTAAFAAFEPPAEEGETGDVDDRRV